jgi:DNA-binding transcriptional MerR regulator
MFTARRGLESRREGAGASVGDGQMQIGEVAERTSLSLRTIRYYEEVGLVPPSARTQGGFRLYTEDDLARLMLVKRMKPLDFSLEEMRGLLEILDRLEAGRVTAAQRADLTGRLALYREIAERRIEALRSQLESAEAFTEDLRGRGVIRARTARRR